MHSFLSVSIPVCCWYFFFVLVIIVTIQYVEIVCVCHKSTFTSFGSRLAATLFVSSYMPIKMSIENLREDRRAGT